MTDPDNTERRLQNLEAVVRAMRGQLDALSEEIGRTGHPAERGSMGVPRPEPSPVGDTWPRVAEQPVGDDEAPPRRTPVPRSDPRSWGSRGLDLEAIIGRYGALGLAGFALVSGLGVFLKWAIARGLLGPEVRVALGLMVAAGLAALGQRLRARGTRRFGNTLLALALALLHMVAWGAGPSLGIVSPVVSLSAAAVASLALALLAWSEGEQALFTVGVGGALLAPFINASDQPNTYILLVYGWIVLTAAAAGVRGRPWSVARGLLAGAALAYAVTPLDFTWAALSDLHREARAIFVLACAWGALGVAGIAEGRVFASRYLIVLLIALLGTGLTPSIWPLHVALAALGVATTHVMLREGRGSREVFVPFVLPLALLLSALRPLDDATSVTGAAIALAWAAAAVLAWLWDIERRDAHFAAAQAASAIAIGLATWDRPVARVIGLAAHTILSLGLAGRVGVVWPFVAAVVALAMQTGWSAGLLQARRAFSYAPFLTSASAAAAVTVAAWSVFAWQLSRASWIDGWSLSERERGFVASLGGVAGFAWGYAELARAHSPDGATFLLIVYCALFGVVAIGLGRRRALTGLRRAGLALAVFAALKAVAQAFGLEPVALRVGSFLLVGGFLLGVAYWYRATEDSSTSSVSSQGEPATAAPRI